MAKSKKHTKKVEAGEKNIEAVEGALSKTEQFIENNQNRIFWIVGIIVVIVAGYIGYTRFVLEPREQSAKAEIYMAEKYFEQDSLELALYGDGMHYGFLDIISEYRFTNTANLAKYYSGISYLRLGEYHEAIDYLESYRADDQILGAMAYGAIGDAYLKLDEKDNAIDYYTDAYNHEPNHLTTPIFLFKAAQLHEHSEQYEEALRLYKKIRDDYPDSDEANNIERYIARTQAKKS